MNAGSGEPYAPLWKAWLLVPILWVLTIQFDLGGAAAVPMFKLLFVPLAAWWARRFGSRGLAAFIAGAWLHLFNYAAGPINIGGGVGLFAASIVVYRLVADRLYWRASIGASYLGVRQLVFIAVVAGSAISIGIPWLHIGGSLFPFLLCVLLIVGRTQTDLRALCAALLLSAVCAAWWRYAVEAGLRVPTQLISANLILGWPPLLLGALLVLFGSRWVDRVISSEDKRRKRSSMVLALVVLAASFAVNCLELRFRLPGQGSMWWSLLAPSTLMAVAFLAGQLEQSTGLRRCALVLMAMVAGSVAASGLFGHAIDLFVLNGGFDLGLQVGFTIRALNALQQAVVAAAFVRLGRAFAARLARERPWGAVERRTDPAPLRFRWLDLALIALVSLLVIWRLLAALGVVTSQ